MGFAGEGGPLYLWRLARTKRVRRGCLSCRPSEGEVEKRRLKLTFYKWATVFRLFSPGPIVVLLDNNNHIALHAVDT